MVKKTNPATNGHAAGKNGQLIGLENEESLLNCIKMQGWVREQEAALLTDMSLYTVGVVSRRLEEKGEIFRDRTHGNAGFFMRLKATGAERAGGRSGKDISIPDCWRHHALAIQTLHFLAGVHKCEFETETSMRQRIRDGKFPDGRLVQDGGKYFFEQELTRKSGKLLRKQIETVARLANEGRICHVAYPYPPAICGGIDHETRQTNALRHKWGSPDAPNIKLVRCHFDSKLAFHNMRPSRFEVIDLPSMISTPASRKPQPGITEQVKGFRWERRDTNPMPLRTEATLRHNGALKFQCVFIEGLDIDDPHVLEVNRSVEAKSSDENQTIHDFMLEQMKIIEKRIEDEMR